MKVATLTLAGAGTILITAGFAAGWLARRGLSKGARAGAYSLAKALQMEANKLRLDEEEPRQGARAALATSLEDAACDLTDVAGAL